ncbi:MAG: VCBS repeat-containing protein [Bacteroidota bacterium]
MLGRLVLFFFICCPAVLLAQPGPISLDRVGFFIAGFADGSAQFADLQGDGDLDLLITGRTATAGVQIRGYVAFDSTFTNAGGEPEDMPWFRSNRLAGVRAVEFGVARWADIDLDGDLDILTAGLFASNVPSAQMYELLPAENALQVGSYIIRPDIALPQVFAATAEWADLDGDGDPDLLIAGATQFDGAPEPITHIYRNDVPEGGGLTLVDTPIPGLLHPSADWADYDGDGDLDLAINGIEASGAFLSEVYRNDSADGSIVLTPIDAGLPGLGYGSMDWGDYDGDGDPDLLIAGMSIGPGLLEGITRVYVNDGGQFANAEVAVAGRGFGQARWIDLDADGDLDVVVSGTRDALDQPAGEYLVNTDGQLQFVSGFSAFTNNSLVVGDFNADGDDDFVIIGRAPTGAPTTAVYANPRFDDNYVEEFLGAAQ